MNLISFLLMVLWILKQSPERPRVIDLVLED